MRVQPRRAGEQWDQDQRRPGGRLEEHAGFRASAVPAGPSPDRAVFTAFRTRADYTPAALMSKPSWRRRLG